jgi:hypothetical protein
MKSLPLLMGAGVLALTASTASAQLISPTADLGAAYILGTGPTKVLVNLEEAAGPMYYLLVSIDDFASLPTLLGPYPLGLEGEALFQAQIPAELEAMLPDLFEISFRPLFMQNAYVNTTQAASIILNDDGCEELDFDLEAGGTPFSAGEILSEQWAPIGLHLSAESQIPASQPNIAIVFDSSNPTGGDTDLVTPGYGPNNTVGLGKLIIMAENDIDANNDDLIDDPDDAFNGGLIHFDFDEAVTMCSATFIDVDDVDPGQGITRLRFYSDAGTTLIQSIICPTGPDNNSTTLYFNVDNVKRLDVKFGGSGALGIISWCPVCIDFDNTSKGIPLDLDVGEQITNQFAAQGFNVSADNHVAGHPDKAIIFDTANPTGGDPDLQTPGYGFGNTIAEGKVIIIAENDVDANNDGNVDDPDDEAGGGNIFFDFDFNVEIEELTFIDVDGLEQSFVQGIDADNNIVGTVFLANLGDNSRQTVDLNFDHVRRFKVHFGGSGSVAGFCFCADPD